MVTPSWIWSLNPALVSNLPFHVQAVLLDGRVDRSRLAENVLLLWLVKLLFTLLLLVSFNSNSCFFMSPWSIPALHIDMYMVWLVLKVWTSPPEQSEFGERM